MTGFPTTEMADFGVAQDAPWLPEVRLIKGEEAPNKEQPARVDGNRERAARSELLNGAEAL
jgi:hypothetical protein